MIYQENNLFKVFPFKAIYGLEILYITDKTEFEQHLLEKLRYESLETNNGENITDEDYKDVALPIIVYEEFELTEEQNNRFNKLKDIKDINLDQIRAYVSDSVEPDSIGFRMIDIQKNSNMLKERQDITEPYVERIKTPTELYEEYKNDENISVEFLKQLKINKLKEDCSEAIYDGFKLQGMHFGMNEHDQQNLTQQLLLIVAGQTENVQWKTKNAGVVSLTTQQFLGITQGAKNHKMQEQLKYWNLEQKVISANTKNEVKIIVW